MNNESSSVLEAKNSKLQKGDGKDPMSPTFGRKLNTTKIYTERSTPALLVDD